MNEIIKIEYAGNIVLTTEQLAQAYECDAKRISENFNRNADRFEEGKHYFKLEGDVLREFKRESANCGIATNVNILYLWTRRGASRHCNRVSDGAQPDAYQDTQSNILDALGFVLGFGRESVLADISAALAGGEPDD